MMVWSRRWRVARGLTLAHNIGKPSRSGSVTIARRSATKKSAPYPAALLVWPRINCWSSVAHWRIWGHGRRMSPSWS